jgi:hypothetical protein
MNDGRTKLAVSKRGASVAWASLIVVGLWPAAAGGAASIDDSSWTWTPQPVVIAVETEGDPRLSPGLVRQVRETIGVEVQARFGAAWKTRITDRFDEILPTDGEKPAAKAGPPPTSDEAAATGEELDEKRIRVLLAHRGGEYVVEALEIDRMLRSTGPLVRRTVRQRGMVGAAAAEAVIAAYRPTARIVDIRGDQGVLRLRGESLLSDEARAELTGRGQGFLPLLRRRDRDGRILSVDRVPWTVLSVRDGGAKPLTVGIISGLRSPLAGRRRGRIEALAIAAGKPSGETVMTITAGAGGGPLDGAFVYDVVAGGPSTLLGTTDQRGRITIAADDGRIRTLVIAGRYLPLARLPLIAGLEPEASAPLPVDARLFDAERRLSNLQSEFTDLLVLRRVLALTAATQLERGDKSAATATLARLGQVGSTAAFTDALEARRRTMELGPSTADRLIDRLYSEALSAMRAVDDRQALAELQKRLAEAK